MDKIQSYFAWLLFLKSLGDKIDPALKLLKVIFDHAKAIVALGHELATMFAPPGTTIPALPPSGGDLQMVARTQPEEELENEIIAAMSADGVQAMVSPMFLYELFMFAKANPWIAEWVLSKFGNK